MNEKTKTTNGRVGKHCMILDTQQYGIIIAEHESTSNNARKRYDVKLEDGTIEEGLTLKEIHTSMYPLKNAHGNSRVKKRSGKSGGYYTPTGAVVRNTEWC